VDCIGAPKTLAMVGWIFVVANHCGGGTPNLF
jgi:hypothetical protein